MSKGSTIVSASKDAIEILLGENTAKSMIGFTTTEIYETIMKHKLYLKWLPKPNTSTPSNSFFSFL